MVVLFSNTAVFLILFKDSSGMLKQRTSDMNTLYCCSKQGGITLKCQSYHVRDEDILK